MINMRSRNTNFHFPGVPLEGKPSTMADGGAIFIKILSNSFSKITIRRSIFNGNHAVGGSGGDIFMKNFDGVASLALEGCVFSNSRSNAGGSVKTSNMNLTISNCTFTECSATQSAGGAIVAANSQEFAKNYVSTNIIITKSFFKGNRASQTGGAISVQTDGVLEIQSSTFGGNSAYLGGSINIRMKLGNRREARSLLHDCTFINNEATIGGAMYIVRNEEDWTERWSLPGSFYSTAIQKCRFWNNSAISSGQSVYNKDHIQMEDTSLITYEKYIAPHLHVSSGDINLSNVTVQLFRDSKLELPSKSKGIVLKSNDIKLSKGLTFLCPSNFNIDGMKNTTGVNSTLKKKGRWLSVRVPYTVYKSFSVDCTACSVDTYTLHSGRLYLPRLTPKYPPENVVSMDNEKCISCPTGK